jgi:hypothetical protein
LSELLLIDVWFEFNPIYTIQKENEFT